jgi:hypothetical protein
MMQTGRKPSLSTWLDAVSDHLTVRRMEQRNLPRPKRNRDRERARREARQLFAQYYQKRALDLAS